MKRLKKYWKRIAVIALSVVAFLAIAFTYLTWNSHDNNYFLNCRWNAVITEPLATMGNRDAQNKMGYFCLFECGPCEPTAQHLINAIYWWEKAAAKGDQDAVKQLEWAKVELAKLLSKGQSDCKREAITAKDSNNLTASDAFVIDGEISDGVIQMTKAGQLGLFLTNSNLFNATKLAISGTINASDIEAIKTKLLALEHLDLSATDLKTIAPHSFVSDRLKTITLPKSVTSIGDSAFYGCSSLTSIAIPNSVTSIENGAFNGCSSLTSITIPRSVTFIGKAAFARCYKAAFTMEHLSPLKYQESMIPEAKAIRVPQSSIDRYKAAEGWKDHQIIGY